MFDKLFEKVAIKVVKKKFEENKAVLELTLADLKEKASEKFSKLVAKAKAELEKLMPEKKAEFEKFLEERKEEFNKFFDEKKEEIKAELIKEIKDSLEKAKKETKKK